MGLTLARRAMRFGRVRGNTLLASAGRNRLFSANGGLQVTASGTTEVDLLQGGELLETMPATSSRTRILTLNRPSALNALSLDMTRGLHRRLRRLDRSENVQCVVLRGAGGRAFCAGADVKALHREGVGGNEGFVGRFFAEEYGMNWGMRLLRDLVVVSVLDGVVMGGGVGLAMGGRFRVATENTVLAMPECLIGLHPDTAMSYWGSRLPGDFGLYLATGARVGGEECLERGLATHFVRSQNIEDMVERLGMVKPLHTSQSIRNILDEFSEDLKDPGREERRMRLRAVAHCFKNGSALEILNRIENEETLQDAAENMRLGCPISLSIALESLRRGKNQNLRRAVEMDYRLTMRLVRGGSFYEGVRATLIDKDHSPKWGKPLEEITREEIESYFRPFSEEEGTKELDFDMFANS